MANVRAFLIENGLIAPSDIPSASGEFRITCPECSNPKQKCYVSGTGRGLHCKHCGFRSTQRAFELRFEPPTPEEIAMEAYVAVCQQALLGDSMLMDWFAKRGIDPVTVASQRFGYHAPGMITPTDIDREIGLVWDKSDKWVLENHIIIPYTRDGWVTQVRGRVHPNDQNKPGAKKYMSLPKAQGQPYYPSRIVPNYPVIIVEGEFDAVILRSHGIQAIGCPGAQHANMDWFKDFNQLYICFDGDNAGREGGTKLLKHLPEVRRIEMPEGLDAGEYILQFGLDSFTTLMSKAALYLAGKVQKEDRFEKLVTDYEDWAWSNGALLGAKIEWAPRFQEMMSGWAPGLILIGAEANSGKSCFKVKSLYELCLDNPDDTVGVYISLDDTYQEALTRLLSLHSGIEFNKVVTPRYSIQPHPQLLQHYQESIESLKAIPNLIVRDATFGRSLTDIKTYFSGLRYKYPDKKLVVFLDSLAKVTGETEDGESAQSTKSNWKAYLAGELKYLTTKHSLCLVTATDLRKLNGIRRPTRDDLKDAAELAYEANIILFMYNDQMRQRENAVLTWLDDKGVTKPIFEVIADKNKVTGKRGTIRFKMDGDTSNFWEYDKAEDDALELIVKAQQAQSRERA